MERAAGTIMLLDGWRRGLLAFLAGAVAILAQAPFDFPAACFVAFPILVWLLDGAAGRSGRSRLRPAFATGWWFGFGYFLAGLWWIGNALLVDAGTFAWALPLAVIALPALLAVFYGLAAVLARLFWFGDLARIVALAAAFGLAEWLRGFVLTGFPWNALGYAAMPVPMLMQSVALIGLTGMNVIAVFVFSLPAAFIAAKARSRAAAVVAAILVIGLHAGYGAWRLTAQREPGPSVDVRIVQPSVEQSEKWDASVRDTIFATYLALTGSPGRPAPLVVWPETAFPFLPTDRPQALAAIGDVLGDDQTLLAGAVRSEVGGAGSGPRYYNALLAIDGGGEIVGAADKNHLVPFGEYLPFEGLLRRWGLGTVVETPISFSPGARRTVLDAGGLRILPLICYEIIFPGDVLADSAAVDLVVNVTNDAWYGATPGPYQHFRQAQVRAVEIGRPVVRAANNGLSGVVDARGRVVDALALDAVGVLDATVPLAPAPHSAGDPGRNGMAVLLLFVAGAMAGAVRHWLRPE